MAQQLLCDSPVCDSASAVIPNDVERMDVFLTAAARGPANTPADMRNFHMPCWERMSAPQPDAGISLTLRRYVPPLVE
ncbi:hypothetical protein ACWGLK_31590 [Streptomyces albidoflavus]|uniref:hypothetical protein n=1 Tax=unclassified Streptomyces TaxID=2593676 RepID=UPI0035E34307